MASEAERLGSAANDSIGFAYLRIAEQWRKMAEGIESSLEPEVSDAAMVPKPPEASLMPLE
jgi:hypothetical protein